MTEYNENLTPLYSIYRYNDQIYKVIKFKGNRFAIGVLDHSHDKHSDEKLDTSLSRTKKVILELALCNKWEFFFTGTFDPSKWNRNNIIDLRKSLVQWFRDLRKVYNSDIAFLIIPEQHMDGSWHFHGLLNGIPHNKLSKFKGNVPFDLKANGIFNWPDFQNKFGFCSLSFVKNPVSCAFYCTKYITKNMVDLKSKIGFHLYSCSHGLKRSVLWYDEFVFDSFLDSCLTDHYEFCSTGFTRQEDGLDWTFGLDHLPILPLDNFSDFDNDIPDLIPVFEQLYFGGIV